MNMKWPFPWVHRHNSLSPLWVSGDVAFPQQRQTIINTSLHLCTLRLKALLHSKKYRIFFHSIIFLILR